MKPINYKITIHSSWHIGSGLSGGVEADTITLKDSQNLPYVPGKVIKGLLREALEEIHEVQSAWCTQEDIDQIFGLNDEKRHSIIPGTHFSNATIPSLERQELISHNLQDMLYENIASNSINEKGLAEEKSLRNMQICLPLALEGTITLTENATEKTNDLLIMGLQWIKHLGLKRSRGLGRCTFSIPSSNPSKLQS